MSKSISMRMAKATTEDQDGAMKLYQLLNAIEGGNFLPDGDEDEDWPEFDADKKDDLVKLHEQLMEVFYAGGLMRVLMAASAMLNPNNKLVDPEKDYLEFHPRFQQMQDELVNVKAVLVGLVGNIEDLIGESDGVAGLHHNGDVATWDELEPGGRYERLTHLREAREIAVAAVSAMEINQPTETI